MVQFNLRLQDDADEKIKFIAETSQRSKNKQIEFIVDQFIKDYEKIHGDIKKNQINKK